MKLDPATMPNLADLQQVCVDGVIGRPTRHALYYCLRHPHDRAMPGTEFAAVGVATRDAAFQHYAYRLGICWMCANAYERGFVKKAALG